MNIRNVKFQESRSPFGQNTDRYDEAYIAVGFTSCFVKVSESKDFRTLQHFDDARTEADLEVVLTSCAEMYQEKRLQNLVMMTLLRCF